MLDGKKHSHPNKLSIYEVEAMYDGSPILGLIKETLGYGKYGMLGKENAIHPEQAAEMFGFSSADEMIREDSFSETACRASQRIDGSAHAGGKRQPERSSGD